MASTGVPKMLSREGIIEALYKRIVKCQEGLDEDEPEKSSLKEWHAGFTAAYDARLTSEIYDIECLLDLCEDACTREAKTTRMEAERAYRKRVKEAEKKKELERKR